VFSILTTRTSRKLGHGQLERVLIVVAVVSLAMLPAALAQSAQPPAATKTPTTATAVKKKPRQPALRFAGRLQMLSGAAFALPVDIEGSRRFVAYVPVDVEIGARLGGPLSLAMGGVGYLAPFSVSTCGPTANVDSRPNALGAFLGARLDFNNSRDGSWWSPWAALRGGILGQNGVANGSPCQERYLLGLYLSPRVGIDLWLGKAAVTFAIGYDHLPRAAALSTQVGLTLRLF
jgi:hypothetical protein